jgi:hypothetical protein
MLAGRATDRGPQNPVHPQHGRSAGARRCPITPLRTHLKNTLSPARSTVDPISVDRNRRSSEMFLSCAPPARRCFFLSVGSTPIGPRFHMPHAQATRENSHPSSDHRVRRKACRPFAVCERPACMSSARRGGASSTPRDCPSRQRMAGGGVGEPPLRALPNLGNECLRRDP